MAQYPTVRQIVAPTDRCHICGAPSHEPCALPFPGTCGCPRPHREWSSYGPAPAIDTNAAEATEAAIETARVGRFDPEG